MRNLSLCAIALALTCCGWAADLQVTTKASAGHGSLRWALKEADRNGEPDTIRFAPSLAGKVIRPLSPLPALTEGGTRLLGSAGVAEGPGVIIDGSACARESAAGLRIESDGNVVSRLVVRRFGLCQILIHNGSYNTIRGCRINTNLDGTAPRVRGDGIWIVAGSRNRIGVAGRGGNQIVGQAYCLALLNTSWNTVANNLIGIDSTGVEPLAPEAVGVALLSELLTCTHNTIGGSRRRDRNIIGGLDTAVLVSGRGAHHNRIRGNYIELITDGTRPLRKPSLVSMKILDGAHHNVIGGRSGGGRNAICGGIHILGEGTDENQIVGNYLGLNAAGTGSFFAPRGITIGDGAGRQYIGGNTPESGNYLCAGGGATALRFYDGGRGSIVQNNRFGIDVQGQAAGFADTGLSVYYTTVRISDNLFANLLARGIYVHKGSPIITRNVFASNPAAIVIGELGTPNLGNVHNASATDDGGNVFLPDNEWYIFSYQRTNIKAEGNNFSTSEPSQINAKIWDKRDDPSLGRIDFRPFIVAGATGGDFAQASGFVLGSLTAVPTSRGVQLTCLLAKPAAIAYTVRNMAGRVVRTFEAGRMYPQGLNTLLWDGRSDTGLPAPHGQYVAELTALTPDGQQVRHLITFRLTR